MGSGNLGLGWTWNGEPRVRVADLFLAADTRDYWTAKLAATREASALSTAWLRGGPALRLPPRTTVSLSLASDQRRASFFTLDASAGDESASGSRSLRVTPLVNLRVSDKLQSSVGVTYETDTVGWQPAGTVGAAPATEYLVARLRQETVSLTLRSDLTFTPRLALQAYLQPFSSTGRYDCYQRLIAPRDPRPERRFALLEAGSVLPAPPATGHRTLNGDLVLRWEYRPGSFLTAVWNHQRDRLFQDARSSPEAGLTDLFSDPPTNVVLLKLSWRFGR